MRRFILPLSSFLLLLALAACLPLSGGGTQTADGGPQTAAPTVTSTVYRPSSTVYPPPSTVIPTVTRPPSTVTSTPEPITLAKTFGLTGDALNAFAGAEKLITRAKDGSYLVTASVRNQETGKLEQIQLTLDPASFNAHPEITNPLGLDTLQAKDADGNPVTLLWLPETREFRLAYDLQPLYDGVNTSNPSLNPEVYAQLPVFTIDDIQSGFAVRNLLLTFSQQMAEGKTLEQLLYADPAATRNAWIKLGGNSLFFEMGSNNDRYAYLKAKGDDVEYSQIHYNAETMKYLPFAAKINLEGKEYFGFYVANFDPVDFDPSHPEQGADPTDIKNWKFFFTLPVHISDYNWNLDPGNTTSDGLNPSPAQYMKEKGFFRRIKNPTPWLIIYADENARSLHPLLAQLLQIKGNDPGDLIFPGYGNKLRDDFKNEFAQLSSEEGKNVIEILIMWNGAFQPLDPNHQRLLFLSMQ
jgi:hypothetical protein